MSALTSVKVLVRSGLLRPMGPLATVRAGAAARTWGKGVASAVAVNAARDPDGLAVIDELGPLTNRQLHERSGRLAIALGQRGVTAGDAVGLLARDHRYFVEAVAAISKLGADIVLLSTAFAAPQLRDVVAREQVKLIVVDEELEDLLPSELPRVLAWAERGAETKSIDDLVRATPAGQPDAPPEGPGRVILLTSGTTGTPKGARRPKETPTSVVLAVLDRIPLRARTRHVIAAPLFHAWGFAHLGLAMLLGTTVIVRRRFDPEETLALIERHGARSVALVPVMAHRILALPPETLDRYDTSTLEIAAFGGSAIPGDLAILFMDRFGDVVYNAYGSTEVAIVSIATPFDLRADHASAGRPVEGIAIRLLDAGGNDVPSGEVGRIFVSSTASFEGYTGGGTKESLEGFMSTGDMGRVDSLGRLSIEGRDDDMIVSGGENVYPREVEDVIGRIDGVEDVAVVGVPDDDFGQRLRAVVVADGVTEDDVRQAVRAELARFKVPRDVVFVDELPRNATGKVLRRELAAT